MWWKLFTLSMMTTGVLVQTALYYFISSFIQIHFFPLQHTQSGIIVGLAQLIQMQMVK